MDEKYDSNFERKIKLLSEQNIVEKKYKVFDHNARIITRTSIPELVERGKTENQSCLVITNSNGETILITKEFEFALFQSLKNAQT
jgi:hypothetical protein